MAKFDGASPEWLLAQQSHVQTGWGSPKTKSRYSTQNFLLLGITVLLAYNAVMSTFNMRRQFGEHPVMYSPANVALRNEPSDSWDIGQDSQWLHGTQNETDLAWGHLMTGLNIRVSEEEMYRTQKGFNKVNDAVELKAGGYVGALGVFHGLHCLETFRVALNSDAYHITEKQRVEVFNREHYDHCIDFLRDNLMCTPDLTVYRATWIKSSKEMDNKKTRSSSQRECANWDLIFSWAKARSLVRGTYLVKPGPYEQRV